MLENNQVYINRFLQGKTTNKKSTLLMYERILSNLAEYLEEKNVPLAEAKQEDLDDFNLKNTFETGTINQFYRWLNKTFIGTNKVRVSINKKYVWLERFKNLPNYDEIQLLLTWCETKVNIVNRRLFLLIFTLLIYEAMTAEEIVNLKIGDIDIKNRTINITDGKIRTITILDKTKRRLQSYLKVRSLLPNIEGCDALLINKLGKVDTKHILHAMKRFRVATGDDNSKYPITFVRLRKTAMSYGLIRGNIKPRSIKYGVSEDYLKNLLFCSSYRDNIKVQMYANLLKIAHKVDNFNGKIVITWRKPYFRAGTSAQLRKMKSELIK